MHLTRHAGTQAFASTHCRNDRRSSADDTATATLITDVTSHGIVFFSPWEHETMTSVSRTHPSLFSSQNVCSSALYTMFLPNIFFLRWFLYSPMLPGHLVVVLFSHTIMSLAILSSNLHHT